MLSMLVLSLLLVLWLSACADDDRICIGVFGHVAIVSCCVGDTCVVSLCIVLLMLSYCMLLLMIIYVLS